MITFNKTIGNVSVGTRECKLRLENITGLVVSKTKLGSHKVMHNLNPDEPVQAASQSIQKL